MKKNICHIVIFALLFFVTTGCELSKVEWVSFDDYSDLDETTSFIPYSVTSQLIDGVSISECRLPGGVKVSELQEDQTKTTATNGAGVIRALINSIGSREIVSYSGTYFSEDESGKRVKLSGRIVLPADGRVSRIMLVSHYTIGHDAEAPSNEVTIESMYAAKGIAVIQSDYLGYGITASRIHPYLCSGVTARNVIDMYFAALPFLKKIGKMPDFDDIYLLGFSQGGAVTMSVAQEFELNPKYNSKGVKIRLTMAGGGPYDICATYDTLMDNDFTDYPCAIPMIVQGMNVGNKLGLDYKDFFLPSMYENLDEWINSKRYTMGEITQLIGSHQISSIMTSDAMNKVNEKMTELYRAMVDNSVVNETMPSCPVYLFHSLDDKVVPFVNAYKIMQKMYFQETNVIFNFGHYGSHQTATLRFMLTCLDLLKKNGDI